MTTTGAAGLDVGYQDGPDTHKYTTATHVTSWTVVPMHDLVTGVRHVFHVPTQLVEEIERSALIRIVTTYRPEKPSTWLGVPLTRVQAVAILLAGITLAVGLWVGFGLFVVWASG